MDNLIRSLDGIIYDTPFRYLVLRLVSHYLAGKSYPDKGLVVDPANRYRAQKEGFNKLAATAGYLSNDMSGGIVATQDKLKQTPDKIARFMTSALKGHLFFTNRRQASINYMMQFFKTKDRDAVSALYDASVKVMTRDGIAEETDLEDVTDEAQRAAGVKREKQTADFFAFSFLRKAREQLKASGRRP